MSHWSDIVGGFLPRFSKRKEARSRARSLYGGVLLAARRPEFYERGCVPDTAEGRFELIALHLWLILRRLREMEEGALAQDLVDVFFEDMEVSLREGGTGDMGVPPRMKRIASAFYGRMAAYDKGLERGGDVLERSLQENLYATSDKSSEREAGARLLACYIMESRRRLEAEMGAKPKGAGEKRGTGLESTNSSLHGGLPFAHLGV